MQNNSLKYLPHIAVLLLVAALFHYEKDCGWHDTLCFNYPYGFYILLRIVVCSYFTLSAYNFYNIGGSPKKFILTAITAIIYNPFIKLSFDLNTWAYINIATIVIILFLELKSNSNTVLECEMTTLKEKQEKDAVLDYMFDDLKLYRGFISYIPDSLKQIGKICEDLDSMCANYDIPFPKISGIPENLKSAVICRHLGSRHAGSKIINGAIVDFGEDIEEDITVEELCKIYEDEIYPIIGFLTDEQRIITINIEVFMAVFYKDLRVSIIRDMQDHRF